MKILRSLVSFGVLIGLFAFIFPTSSVQATKYVYVWDSYESIATQVWEIYDATVYNKRR